MLRVLIREEQQICVTKVPVSSFYVRPLSPQQSNSLLIELFLDSYFLRKFHIYQKLARTFAPAEVPDAKDFYVSDLPQYFKRWNKIQVRCEHTKHKITKYPNKTKKPKPTNQNHTKMRIICPSKKKKKTTERYNYTTK